MGPWSSARRGRHAARARFPGGRLLDAVVLLLVAAGLWAAVTVGPPVGPDGSSNGNGLTAGATPINRSFPGITTFRGNATRTYYGEGPVPTHPEIQWRFPAEGKLCRFSEDLGVEREWCGIGWTGQPNVIEHADGTVEVRFGAFDGDYHFLDGLTGRPIRPNFATRDLAKGSASTDPDGYPLYYAGSRDNYFRIIALDRDQPTALWRINSVDSVPDPRWNDDWDGAALVIGDYLLEGSEASWLYVIRLNRGYGPDGLVTVDPEVVATIPSFDPELEALVPDGRYSIETSVAFRGGVVYFGNSAGLVQGYDISDILDGGTTYRRVFRFWVGDDVDATPVIDDEGFLYVAAELERFNPRGEVVGQLVKLDPRQPADPVVWSAHFRDLGYDGNGGIFSTPAISGSYLYVATNHGELVALDRRTGEEAWRYQLAAPTWSSPVVVDDVLILGDCSGVLHGYDVSDPGAPPPELWNVRVDGCIEATPAVWEGMIYVGSRGGALYGIGDPS